MFACITETERHRDKQRVIGIETKKLKQTQGSQVARHIWRDSMIWDRDRNRDRDRTERYTDTRLFTRLMSKTTRNILLVEQRLLVCCDKGDYTSWGTFEALALLQQVPINTTLFDHRSVSGGLWLVGIITVMSSQ